MEYQKLPLRVLMINGNQLLKDTFRKVIKKYTGIAVVAETKQIDRVPRLVLQQKPDWLLLFQPPQTQLPAEILQAIDQNRDLKLISIATDASKIEIMKNPTSSHEVNVDHVNQIVEIMLDSSSSLAEFDHQRSISCDGG
ncbi:MAG: hypothetical protein V2J07_03910 [Anaerolineae bacterium]|nr:hypothetical protein [Anaerolineae bacterium]